jgi:SH3-like domain-containing protein
MSYSIDKLITTAKNEEGYLEKKTNSNLYDKTANAGFGNFTKYAYEFDTKYTTFYNGRKNGYDWCDMFVDWCFVKTFGEADALKLLGQPKKSCGAGCPYSADYFKKIGRFYTTPKVGDQIFFKGSNGRPCHTGLVYNIDNVYVYTIEGNTSSASGVVANGGCVAKKKYTKTSSYIYGYGRPDYGTQTTTTAKKETETKKETTTKKYKSFTGYVTADVLNVRTGAGTTYKDIGDLRNGKSVTVIGETNGWYKIKYNNDTGYVSKQYISKTKPKTNTFKSYKVKVTANIGLNIRKSANNKAAKIGAIPYGTIVTVTKKSGNWGYIATKKGWIHLSYTKKV